MGLRLDEAKLFAIEKGQQSVRIELGKANKNV
jgi:hypothetical protein